MKTKGRILIIAILVLGYSCTSSRPYSYPRQGNQQGRNISMQVFYDELSPHGYWVHNREYGYVWIPHVGRNFFPYASDGRWVMTQYGWTWVSDFSWGWAPFHYGRWDFDPNYGWFWFPGNEWAPAWVTWRYGNGYYGWAPMGPGGRPGIYPGSMYENDAYRWVFVRDNDFGRPNIYRYAVNQRRNNEILRSSRVIDNARRDDSRRVMYNPGPDLSEVEKATNRRIRRLEVRDSNTPGRRVSNNTLEIYRPRVEMRAEGNRPAPPVINDVKDIKPMRERDSRYNPQNQVELDEMRTQPETGGQGSRSIDREQEQVRREREVERQSREKQEMRQRRQQELELERQEKELENRSSRSEREYRQNAQERQQKTDKQRKVMQKERRTRETEATDTSRTRRIQQETTRQRR